jgi:two-component system phosphate regulon sensor histidine kinase PhoR
VLSARSNRLRDLLLFAALALLPAVAVGVLGLRALRGEEAAQRREALVALTVSAERVRLRFEQDLAEADAALAAANLDPDPRTSLATLERITPAFAVPVALGKDRALVAPAFAPPTQTDPACEALAEKLSRAADPRARIATRGEILVRCAEARLAGGRFLYPIAALEGLGAAEADDIVRWIEAHAPLLAQGEREATREEVARAPNLPEDARARALSALGRAPASPALVRAALRSEAATVALRAGPDRAGMIRFRAEGAVGVLRSLGDGALAGFIVHPASISAALARGFGAMAEGHRAELAEGMAPEPSAITTLAPGLQVRVAPADPAAVARRASRSRALLAAIGLGAVVLSFGLAALLYARMRAARRTSELRVDFVAAVSHELRTPVASLRMLSELLAEGRVEPEEQAEVFDALGREARRLGDTVERMMALGRMAKGKLSPVRADEDVVRVVREAVEAFEQRCPELSPIERHLDAEAPAHIDAAQVRLAVDNLLENARKYAPQGIPYEVTVQRARGGVTVQVKDRGPGIARRDQRRIFEPFERLDDKLSQSTQGSGLGLSLVRHVAEGHGGWVRVESAPGEGASFTIFLPERPR